MGKLLFEDDYGFNINSIPVKGEGGLLYFIKKGEISLDEMIEFGLSQQKIIEIKEHLDNEKKEKSNRINATAIYNQIKNNELDVIDIRELILEGKLSEAGLAENTDIKGPIFNTIKNYIKRETPFNTWSDSPPLADNRTDLYFLGSPGSGKSCILASIFLYASKNGLIIESQINPEGNYYRNLLTEELNYGILPNCAPSIDPYIPIDLAENYNDEKEHPLNFIEMSVVLFDQAYSGGISDKYLKAKNYFSNKNRKLIFFVIDFDHRFESDPKLIIYKQSEMINTLSLIDSFGTFKKTDHIYIIVSKSDLFPNNVNKLTYAEKFLNKYYKNFLVKCRILKKKYKNSFDLTILPYTIGEIKYKRLLTRFDEGNTIELLNSIYYNSNQQGKKPWYKKLFS